MVYAIEQQQYVCLFAKLGIIKRWSIIQTVCQSFSEYY